MRRLTPPVPFGNIRAAVSVPGEIPASPSPPPEGAISRAPRTQIGIPVQRPTSWWLEMLKRRAERMYDEKLDLSKPVEFSSDEERTGLHRLLQRGVPGRGVGPRGAHKLAEEVREWDPELAECLVLYGNEEGWHRELLDGVPAPPRRAR